MVSVEYKNRKEKKRFIGNCEDNIVEQYIASAQFGKHCSLEHPKEKQETPIKFKCKESVNGRSSH